MLILASTSPYRRQLLERLRLPFQCVGPGTDERPRPAEPPADLAPRLAAAKAAAVAASRPDAWVIGSDQCADLEGRILGKPGGREAAIAQLAAASGRTVDFHTAVCLRRGDRVLAAADLTRVRFRRLDAAEIARYVDAERPYDCAGSFKCEGLGIALFEAIETRDPTALVGLPLIALTGLLREAGHAVP
ncbi:septum formation inhibitor Maf [Pseudoxanthomonas broegbernensis]|uniref:7-methyl-GTP pyrophosphatase n=1 Tax=Pseudoxanthomonas broegbernensis TaxID=83619 RepID=A0A7V8K7S9_9GAMM|nr:Maf family nucleotide pyrophosphatase [Pseudoxanthomonas broegbernensis]KAF1687513.1 septum formation inhibitor Maf [Pseudoxanthomonas broegbernensis]MBB6064518.1 septum formation protein [Pseudoxanthomonas broegbernensis]